MRFLKKHSQNLSIIACLLLANMVILSNVFAQKVDSNRINLRAKSFKAPIIKGSVPTYQPKIYTYLSSEKDNQINESVKTKNEKNLIIFKIFPIPVEDKININFKLSKDNLFLVKITDLLGNDVFTLTNDKLKAGEYTKTYTIPAKLNAGVYFLRIVAGGEPIIKRISVL